MKPMFFLLAATLLASGIISCKKNTPSYHSAVSLRVVNALINGSTLKLNSNERDSVLMYNIKSFSLAITNNESTVQIWPTSGGNKPYYDNKISTQDGDLYSLYLYGWAGNAESLLIKEQIASPYADSAVGVRVAHLSPGTGAVNINLKSDPTHSIISGVNYKSISKLVKIPLLTVIPAGSASFEVRNATDNKMLATYTLPNSANSLYRGISVPLQRFKNITLVLKGSRDTLSGPNAFGIFPAAVSY